MEYGNCAYNWNTHFWNEDVEHLSIVTFLFCHVYVILFKPTCTILSSLFFMQVPCNKMNAM